MIRNKHSSRAFTAFVVTWAFLVLTITGLVLYVVPQGRIANWLQWNLLGLDKESWADLHLLFGLVFIVAGAVHLWFNWKPFRNYLADRARGHLTLKAELLSSLAFSVVVAVGAIMHLPPFSSVFELNDRLKNAWADGAGKEPPFGRAEEAALPALANRVGFDHAAAVQALRAANVRVDNEQASLLEIARNNGTTPAALYALLPKTMPALPALDERAAPEGSSSKPRKAESPAPDSIEAAGPAPAVAPKAPDPQAVEARLSGSGIGNKTLAGFAEAEGIAVKLAVERLRELGIEASADDRFKLLADKLGVKPVEIAKAVVIPGYRPQPAP